MIPDKDLGILDFEVIIYLRINFLLNKTGMYCKFICVINNNKVLLCFFCLHDWNRLSISFSLNLWVEFLLYLQYLIDIYYLSIVPSNLSF